MNPSPPPLREVLQQLDAEGRIAAGCQMHITTALTETSTPAPWYVRLMIIASVWLATLLLLLFIGGTQMVNSAVDAIVAGVVLLGAAIALHWRVDSELLRQIALALSLTGQLLIILGIGDEFGITEAAIATIILQGMLFLGYPDYLHRFASILFFVLAILVLIYDLEEPNAIHLLTLSLMAAVVLHWLRYPKYLTTPLRQYLQPAGDALVVALFVVLSILAFISVVDLHIDFPNPHLSTAGMGITLLVLEARLLVLNGQSLKTPASLATFAVTVIFLVPAIRIPGLVAAIAVLLLGFQWAHRMLMGLSLSFLAIFLCLYYYQLELSLLMKSAALAGSGVILLLMRILPKALKSHTTPLEDA